VSGWYELGSLGVTVRPLTEPRPAMGNRYSPFSANLTSTVELLATELRALEATQVVIEMDLRERDIRIDGLPRADAKPSHDGVALSFQSKFGPLRYATAEFTGRWGQQGWEANLRAIALSMQALRAVDRYGVSKRGEQYTGWRAIPMSTDPAQAMTTPEQAREFLRRWDGDVRRALRDTHPDTGGDEDEFRTVIKARELIGA
jgi:hypothetical protein